MPNTLWRQREEGATADRHIPEVPTKHTRYLSHLMYAYIRQGRPDAGLLRLIPSTRTIITQGIGVYPSPLLQSRQTTTRTAMGNPVYI